MTHLQFLGSKVTALWPSKNRCRPTGPTFPPCPWSVSKAQKKTDLCSLPPLSWDVWYSSLTEQWVNPPSLSPSQQANIPVTTPTAEPINCLVYERNQWSPTTYTVSRWFHVVIILLTAISVQERNNVKNTGHVLNMIIWGAMCSFSWGWDCTEWQPGEFDVGTFQIHPVTSTHWPGWPGWPSDNLLQQFPMEAMA